MAKLFFEGPLATIVTLRPFTALPTTVSSCAALVELDMEMPKMAPNERRTGDGSQAAEKPAPKAKRLSVFSRILPLLLESY